VELKLNDKYLVLDNPTRYFIITGGRGSSKSYSINTLLTLLTFEAGHKILFTRYTLRAASISIIPEFIEKLEVQNIEHNFHITKDEIINKQTGSKILFRGIKTSSGDQTANLKSIQGVTTFVLDEAEELTDESIFDKIDLSVRQKDKDNRVILILNPTTKENFIYKRWFEDRGVKAGSNLMKGDTTYVHTTYLDNIENLSKSYIEQIEQMKVRRPNRYKHTIMGSWLDKAEGVIYSNWSIGEFKQVGKIVFGQDYGFSNDPSTLIKTSIDKDNKVIYVQQCVYQTKLTTSELTILNKKYAGKNLIVGDSAEPRLISEIKSSGCNIVAAIKGQGSITYGISLLQDYDLVIDPESIELIKELNNYCWLEKKSQTPQDSFNHCLDALRYSVSYQLQNPNSGEYFLY
jgi:phage terminase large subunit